MTEVQNFSRGPRSGHEKYLVQEYIKEYLGSLLLPVRNYIDELRSRDTQGEQLALGRCIRNVDGSTRGYERIRRSLKQVVEAQGVGRESEVVRGADQDLGAVMPPNLLSTIYGLTKGRHTGFPEPGTQKPGADDIDLEWTTHIATKVLLYRMAVGTGINRRDNTRTLLGPPPHRRGGFLSVDDANLLYADVVRDLRGTSLEPFAEDMLERFTVSHPGDIHQGIGLTSEQAQKIADLQGISMEPALELRLPYMRAARATGFEPEF